MMDQNQSNEDALQKAIDDITNNALNENAAAPAMSPDLTMPDMPVAGPVSDIPAAPAMSEAPVAAPEAPAMPEVATEPVTTTEPVAEEPAAPVSNQNTNSGDLKERALRDLAPVLNKVDLEPEKKFQIYLDMIETLGDNSVYEDTYNAASAISDEKARGEALLKLIEILDK